jgi:glycosyltransferase involved in cell wall biosynthesis
LIRRVAHAATRVIADSESARGDLVRLLRADERRVDVVPLGVDARFRPPAPADLERATRRLGLRPPYLLFVGNLEPRKNLPGLIDAFRRVRASHPSPPRLVVAGKVAWKSGPLLEALAAPDLRDTVQVTGYVDAEDLPALYGGAEAFVFPSFWEGFGLPVLEAMGCGTPVVVSRVAALPEVAGDAAVWVDPASAESIANGILEVLTQPARRAQLVAKGLARAREFPWERTARSTLATYARAREEARR